jgi:hypothetical protein
MPFSRTVKSLFSSDDMVFYFYPQFNEFIFLMYCVLFTCKCARPHVYIRVLICFFYCKFPYLLVKVLLDFAKLTFPNYCKKWRTLLLIEVHLCTAINCLSQLEENDLFSMASLRLFTPWEFVDYLSLPMTVFNSNLILFLNRFLVYFYNVSKNGAVFRLSFEFTGIFPALKALLRLRLSTFVSGQALCIFTYFLRALSFLVTIVNHWLRHLLWASWPQLCTIGSGIYAKGLRDLLI